ncbi:RDD family protein [[Mycoplasma] gypis]|uniref:RDD family protein n=1 Tax=[Mycoplasma] gypis TaxID=92404 RepID=A0ABZ2RMV7_9BACT|nr:RDD family protein [[Mycoplasma] gypis]MBN0919496.1 RDD family protein [[Mycoplasma] gypis]
MTKTITTNKKAGFWPRFLATLIDLFIFMVIVFAFSFIVFDNKTKDFKSEGFYYLWLSLIIITDAFIWVLLPILTKGRTLGLLCFRLKIVSKHKKDPLWKTVLKRQLLFAVLWIIVFACWMIFISKDTFVLVLKTNKQNINQLNWIQRIFVTIPLTLSALTAIINWMMIISNAKSSRVGWNDTFSYSYTVYANKFETIVVDEWNKNKLKPVVRKMPNINFKY